MDRCAWGIGSVERVMGIEPTWPAWKAGALPLSYTRITRIRIGGARTLSIRHTDLDNDSLQKLTGLP